MFCGSWNVDLTLVVRLSVIMLAGALTESARSPPPTFKIINEGNYLKFHSSPPNSTPHCWKYMFQYRKCNEQPVPVTVTEDERWIAKVEYDAACKYAVQVQAKYDTIYCGNITSDSDYSELVYFGQDDNPNLPFIVATIVIPLIVCACLIISILLFRRHKDKFLPKVPSPSNFFKEMFDSNKEMTKGLYVGELYVPNEEVVEEIHVEPKSTQSTLQILIG